MLKKKNQRHSIQWLAFFFMLFFCLSIVGLYQQHALKKQCDLTAELAQSHLGKSSGSILDQALQNPQFVCLLQSSCFKQNLEFFQSKKGLIPVMDIPGLDDHIDFILSNNFSVHNRTYYFIRLSVLSSQNHPPTLV